MDFIWRDGKRSLRLLTVHVDIGLAITSIFFLVTNTSANTTALKKTKQKKIKSKKIEQHSSKKKKKKKILNKNVWNVVKRLYYHLTITVNTFKTEVEETKKKKKKFLLKEEGASIVYFFRDL